MKILLVTDAAPPQVNGVVITLTTLAQELLHLGHEVRMITPVMFRTMPCPTYPEIRLALLPYRGVRTAILEARPDALHIATEGPLGIAARRVCMQLGLPFTSAYHTRFPEYVRARVPVPLRWSYAWLRRFHGAAERVMVATESMRAELAAHKICHTVIWSRGVDTGRFEPEGPRTFRRDQPVFMYVGRVAVEKNLRAFLDLDLPGSKWVVGGGPQLRELQEAYPAVNFAGPKPHAALAPWYRSADVFVFPSRTDTFGLVLLEALACGVPVAAFPVPGPLDVIGASGAGVLDQDLRRAALGALRIPRSTACAHARNFSWSSAARNFASFLSVIPGTTTGLIGMKNTSDRPEKNGLHQRF